MRSPAIATASARGPAGDIVSTRALVRTVSGLTLVTLKCPSAGTDSNANYWSTDLGVASIRRTTILVLSIMSGIRGPISVAQ